MADMTSFPILRLPSLAFREVLKSMEPKDLITYSTISSKTKKTVKSFTRSKKNLNRYKIELIICQKPVLSIGSKSVQWVKGVDKWLYRIKNFRYNGQEIVSKYNEETDLDKFKKWAEYIQDILNCRRFHKILLDTDAFPEQNQSIIDWLKSRSRSFEYVELIGENEGDELVAQVTKKLKISQNLDLSVKLSNQFEGNLPKGMFQIVINHGQWITVDQLLKFEAMMLVIKTNTLSVDNLNTYIRAWMAKQASECLTYFQVNFEQKDLNQMLAMLHDLPGRRFGFNITRTITICNKRIKIRGGIDVRRVDRSRATLFICRNNLDQLTLVMAVR